MPGVIKSGTQGKRKKMSRDPLETSGQDRHEAWRQEKRPEEIYPAPRLAGTCRHVSWRSLLIFSMYQF
jgi:hypothetical protein